MTYPHFTQEPYAGAPQIVRGSMPALAWQGLGKRTQPCAAGAPAWQHSAAALKAQGTPTWESVARKRRNWLMFWVFGATLFATALLWRAQPGSGLSLLQGTQLALFSLLFAWVSAGTVTAVMGFWVSLRGDRYALSAKSAEHITLSAQARTAVIMPICNEDVATVFAGLRATCESLVAAGAERVFDVFVLSDTNNPELRVAELMAWQALRDQLHVSGSKLQVHYRWRQHRTRRKAGNVADFCRRWGKAYRYMAVLDADSVMTGDTLVTLARLMEANPRAGIMQTAPRTCGHASVHARAQQFASRVTGRMFTAGMQFWQLGEAHYWGHNAIIRVAPFMQHCGLAKLAGKGGLSGEILSHDFVEAALMRRAGYEVWLVNDLEGSYEQQPPHVLAELQRDKRWCQGNLQNARLIAEPGLRPVHRAMLATGAMAYVSAPLWLAYVVLGASLWMGDSAVDLWPNQSVLTLWASTALMLLLPRILGLATVLLRREQVSYGGLVPLLGSAALEACLSVLQAPLRMAAHTWFVAGALLGLKIEWKSPPREATDLQWSFVAARLAPLGVAVLAALVGVWFTSPTTVLWLLPIGLPLMLAVPVTVLSSRSAWGKKLRKASWLSVPEENLSPSVLTRAWAYAHHGCVQVTANMWATDLPRLASLATLALGHRTTVHGVRGTHRRMQVLQMSRQGTSGNVAKTRMHFLSEPHSLRLLHAAMLGQPLGAPRAH